MDFNVLQWDKNNIETETTSSNISSIDLKKCDWLFRKMSKCVKQENNRIVFFFFSKLQWALQIVKWVNEQMKTTEKQSDKIDSIWMMIEYSVCRENQNKSKINILVHSFTSLSHSSTPLIFELNSPNKKHNWIL